MQQSNSITLSGPDSKWVGLFQIGPVSTHKTPILPAECNVSSEAALLRLRLLQTKRGYQQLMFLTQHSSVTVDGKLSPTVNALLSGGQDFSLDSRCWGNISLWTPEQLSCSDRSFWKSSFSASARSFNSHYSKTLPVRGKGSPDGHVSDSPAQGNIRSLFIWQKEPLCAVSHVRPSELIRLIFGRINRTFCQWRSYLYGAREG